MQRWEHLIITLKASQDDDWDTVRQTLDRHGAEGWELVAYQYRPLADVQGGTSLKNYVLGAGATVDMFHIDSFAIFKRPLAA